MLVHFFNHDKSYNRTTSFKIDDILKILSDSEHIEAIEGIEAINETDLKKSDKFDPSEEVNIIKAGAWARCIIAKRKVEHEKENELINSVIRKIESLRLTDSTDSGNWIIDFSKQGLTNKYDIQSKIADKYKNNGYDITWLTFNIVKISIPRSLLKHIEQNYD